MYLFHFVSISICEYMCRRAHARTHMNTHTHTHTLLFIGCIVTTWKVCWLMIHDAPPSSHSNFRVFWCLWWSPSCEFCWIHDKPPLSFTISWWFTITGQLGGFSPRSARSSKENFLRKWIRSTLDVFTLEATSYTAAAWVELSTINGCLHPLDATINGWWNPTIIIHLIAAEQSWEHWWFTFSVWSKCISHWWSTSVSLFRHSGCWWISHVQSEDPRNNSEFECLLPLCVFGLAHDPTKHYCQRMAVKTNASPLLKYPNKPDLARSSWEGPGWEGIVWLVSVGWQAHSWSCTHQWLDPTIRRPELMSRTLKLGIPWGLPANEQMIYFEVVVFSWCFASSPSILMKCLDVLDIVLGVVAPLRQGPWTTPGCDWLPQMEPVSFGPMQPVPVGWLQWSRIGWPSLEALIYSLENQLPWDLQSCCCTISIPRRVCLKGSYDINYLLVWLFFDSFLVWAISIHFVGCVGNSQQDSTPVQPAAVWRSLCRCLGREADRGLCMCLVMPGRQCHAALLVSFRDQGWLFIGSWMVLLRAFAKDWLVHQRMGNWLLIGQFTLFNPWLTIRKS